MMLPGLPSHTERTGVVVVGTGAAGLSVLLHLAAAGIDAVAITRGEVTDSATAWAQGGLAAVWDADDNLASHVTDTLVAGAGLCDEQAVTDLVAAAPDAIRNLIGLGARFDVDTSGTLDLHLEGGHSARRIIHADGDASGAEVERALWEALQHALRSAEDTPSRFPEPTHRRFPEPVEGPEPTPHRSPEPTPHRSPEPTPHRFPEPTPHRFPEPVEGHQTNVDRVEGSSPSTDQRKSRIRTGTRLVDVLTDDDARACGVRVLADDGSLHDILADAVVLATGGIGQLWPVTSNPSGATGDGVAAALRAGAVARDLEFMQFHPTVLADDDAQHRGVLVSEAVRGEGAVLIGSDGERIMTGDHPLADLAPRDVVSAAIMAHLESTREPHVFLDATEFGSEKWERTFPGILALCRERGIDPVTQPIPVHPAAHYSCGGVAADLDGRTSVPGLFAVGEVAATGVHGANRLASNSLTEALVAGDRLGRLLTSAPLPSAGPPAQRPCAPLFDETRLPALKQAMQEHAFVARTDAGLRTLQARLSEPTPRLPEPIPRLSEPIPRLSEPIPRLSEPVEDQGNGVVQGALTATNLLLVARALVVAARMRTESRGCHRRADHPETDPAWERRIDVHLSPDGTLTTTHQPLTRPERTAA